MFHQLIFSFTAERITSMCITLPSGPLHVGYNFIARIFLHVEVKILYEETLYLSSACVARGHGDMIHSSSRIV